LWQATAAGGQLTVEASDMPRQATAAGVELCWSVRMPTTEKRHAVQSLTASRTL